MKIRKMQTAAGGPLFPWQQDTEWVDNWKFRTTPASRSRVLSGKGVETDKQYTERRKKETTKRTWRSDAADVAHGIGEGVLALHPYTAIPYFGAKVGQDFLNGTYGWHTALNASVPLFHMAPQAVGLREATNVALEDAANAGSKTARNWRVAREINQTTKNKPKYTRVPSKNLFRTQVYKGGEITDPYSNFITTDSQYAANYGKVTPYIFESKSVAKAKEPMMGSSDPVTMDMFIYNNTKRNPNATAIIGHDKVTGEFNPSKGIEILNMNPKNLYSVKTSDSPTSLKFFERPTLSNAQELAGATKWERNFKPKWHVANYPGYQLKGLMKGSQLEKQLSKNGTININQLNAYFNKASQLEREVANKVLAEKFAGQKTIDYNQFKKAVQDELINYSTKPQMKYSTYGMDRLGFNVIREPDGAGGIIEYLPGIRTNTFTFESPKISVGNNKHYDSTTLGHSRTYTTPDEPNVLHVMESQSDWGQSHVKMMPSVQAHQIAVEKALKSGNTNAFHSFTNRLGSLLADKLTKYERIALENINKEIESGQPSGFQTIEDLWSKKYEILKKAGNRSNIGVQGQHLHDNYLQRQLQENLRYAAENGQTKMRYPIPETAAKIEGYTKQSPSWEQIEVLEKKYNRPEGYVDLGTRENFDFESLPEKEALELSKRFKIYEKWDESQQAKDFWKEFNNIGDYYPQHQTILKKYADFPKLFQKLFKDQKVRTVTDAKGNTWYEVDVPKGYLSREWQFKQGGKMNILEFLKNGSGIHIKEKNKGSFTRWCGGNVTEECIRRGKNSPDPKIRKKATFADNARHFKHKEGGKAFVTGINVLDSNPKAYKYVKKKYKMAQQGTKLNFFQKAGNWLNNNGDLVKSVANAGLGILGSIQQNKAIDSQIEANKKQMEVNKQKAFMENYKKALGLQTDRSDIINMNRAWQMANSQDYSGNEELMEENAQLENSRSNGLPDYLGGLASSILNNPNLFKKSNTGIYNQNTDIGSTTYNWKTNTFTNKNKVGTINSNGSMNTGIGGTTYNWKTNTFGSNNIMNSFDKIKF